MAEIAAVIPTQGRASLERAVKSVLRQDVDADVVVVADGREHVAAVEMRLAALGDLGSSVRLTVLPVSQGGGAARNAGVVAATARLIGFLDDDDEWLPEKARRVIAAADSDRNGDAIISHAYRQVRGTGSTRVLPVKSPPATPNQLAEYLLSRSRLRYGSNSMQTSTLVTTRVKAITQPWPVIGRHQDWAWLLDCASAGTRLIHLNEPLSNVYVGDTNSVSRTRRSPEMSQAFLIKFASDVPRRAGSDFYATEVLRRTPMSAWPQAIIHARDAGVRLGMPHAAALALALAARLSSRSRGASSAGPELPLATTAVTGANR